MYTKFYECVKMQYNASYFTIVNLYKLPDSLFHVP